MISENCRDSHRRTAARVPMTSTSRKLMSVSARVMPVCKKRLPSRHMDRQVRVRRLGQLKIKASMRPLSAAISHRHRNTTRRVMREAEIIRRCFCCF